MLDTGLSLEKGEGGVPTWEGKVARDRGSQQGEGWSKDMKGAALRGRCLPHPQHCK